MNDGWDKLLRAARAVLNEREVSPFVYAGQVGAAVETERGNIYVGACVDGVCGLSTRRAPPSTPCSPPGNTRVVPRGGVVKKTAWCLPCEPAARR